MLEEKNAEVEHYRNRMERMQREYEERLHGTATELQRLQLEKTLLQVGPTFLQSAMTLWSIARAAASWLLLVAYRQCVNIFGASLQGSHM